MPDASSPASPPPPTLATGVVCPLTHSPLSLDPSGNFLVSPSGIKYPIKDGIPILLPTAAIHPATQPLTTGQ